MEPKKIASSFAVSIATLIGIIAFFADSEKLKLFLFPKNREISLSIFIITLASVTTLISYIGYYFYYEEKQKYRKVSTELKNANLLLFDLEKLRLIDFITGIPNEAKFKIDLNNRPKELFHLIILDLDGFSVINKKQGFQKGDEVIRTIAQDLFIKMRRDEEIYKLSYKIKGGFFRRIYRKYTGGDEFIFLIKGPQYEAIGFITRIQRQLKELSRNSKFSLLKYEVKFHAAIVPLYPADTYELAYDRLQRGYVLAVEEKDDLKVFWDKSTEVSFLKTHAFIYANARTEFAVAK